MEHLSLIIEELYCCLLAPHWAQPNSYAGRQFSGCNQHAFSITTQQYPSRKGTHVQPWIHFLAGSTPFSFHRIILFLVSLPSTGYQSTLHPSHRKVFDHPPFDKSSSHSEPTTEVCNLASIWLTGGRFRWSGWLTKVPWKWIKAERSTETDLCRTGLRVTINYKLFQHIFSIVYCFFLLLSNNKIPTCLQINYSKSFVKYLLDFKNVPQIS